MNFFLYYRYIMVKQCRLAMKGTAHKFKDDAYETPEECLKTITHLIDKEKVIYDPFYCRGEVITQWAKLGYKCINEKKDAFDREHPDYDIMISNIPFSCKEKCVELAVKLGKPFMLLMPIDCLGSVWIKKYWDKLSFVIPRSRYNFLKEGVMGKGCWFDTMWVCYDIGLEHKIIKL